MKINNFQGDFVTISAAQATAGFSDCDLGAMACDAVLGVMNEALAADRSADIVRIPPS